MPRIVCISGTSRPDNYTARALAVVHAALVELGHESEIIDARDLALAFPGEPVSKDARRVIESVRAADAVVLATPEYHGTFSAMTKLIIENLGFPSALKEKPVALVGVASGRIGAIKSLEHLRGVCAHVGAIVLPGSVSIAGVQKAFDRDGTLIDEATGKSLRGVAASLTSFIRTYVCPRMILEEEARRDQELWASAV